MAQDQWKWKLQAEYVLCGCLVASSSLILLLVRKDVIIPHLCSEMSLWSHLFLNGQVSLHCKFTSHLAPDDILFGDLSNIY